MLSVPALPAALSSSPFTRSLLFPGDSAVCSFSFYTSFASPCGPFPPPYLLSVSYFSFPAVLVISFFSLFLALVTTPTMTDIMLLLVVALASASSLSSLGSLVLTCSSFSPVRDVVLSLSLVVGPHLFLFHACSWCLSLSLSGRWSSPALLSFLPVLSPWVGFILSL